MEYLLARLFIVDAGGSPSLDELLIEVLKRLDEKLVSQQCLGLRRAVLPLPVLVFVHVSSVYPSSFGGAL
jgi:hypothetical protein